MDREQHKEALDAVRERARRDPEFFHRLIYDPESVLSELPESRSLKAAVLGINPDTFWVTVLARPSDILSEWDPTCSRGTCASTCAVTVASPNLWAEIINPEAIGWLFGARRRS